MNFKKKDQRTLDYAIFACFCLYEGIPTCTLKIEQQRPPISSGRERLSI